MNEKIQNILTSLGAITSIEFLELIKNISTLEIFFTRSIEIIIILLTLKKLLKK